MNTKKKKTIMEFIIMGGVILPGAFLYSAFIATTFTFWFDKKQIVSSLQEVLLSPNLFLYLGIVIGVSIFIVLLFNIARSISIEPEDSLLNDDDLVFESDIDESNFRNELSKQVEVNYSAILTEYHLKIAIKDFLKRKPELKELLNKSGNLEMEFLNGCVPVEVTFSDVKINWKGK